MIKPGYKALWSIVAMFFAITGCAILPTNGQVNFSAYAEKVFRHQNAVSSRLMLLNDTDAIDDEEAINSAEESMIEACHYLNEYAERANDAESIDWSFKAKVQASVEPCDKAVWLLEAILDKATLKK
jgi:hypothetical protein